MKLNLKSFSLANIAKTLKLSEKQTDFDYDILNKDEWTNQDKIYIKKYTLQDIRATYDVWKYIENFFEPFKEYLTMRDQATFKHITLSLGTYVYKVICKEIKAKEEYGDSIMHDIYKGGFVSSPSEELVTGKILCVDFNSMYPHNYMQANLFSNNCDCCTEDEKYTGGKLFELRGKYCTKKQGKIEEVIKKFYALRKEYKSNKDAREYVIKIVLNVMYGVCGNPGFLKLYNIDTASDCTHVARTCVKLARKKFKDAGYDVLYSDTDSVYIKNGDENENKIMNIKEQIISEIKASVPFPQDTFDMGIDERIKLIYFPGLLKKNYLYVTEDNKMEIKGLPFKKSNASKISMLVFEKHMKERIINHGEVKFGANEIKKWVYEELEKDITLATLEFKTADEKSYKKNSQLQAQISKRYGTGTHRLVPNVKRVGAGIGKGYCTIEEFKKEKLQISDIDLKKTYSELNVFCSSDLNEVFRIKKTKKLKNQTLEAFKC